MGHILLLIFFVFSCAAQATVLVAKVSCEVRDPGTLRELMELAEGARVSMASFDDDTSDLDHNGVYAVTQYPGSLGFEGANFALNQAQVMPPNGPGPGRPMELRMTGRIEGDRQGVLHLRSPEGEAQPFSAQAQLQFCQRSDFR